jgi:glycosyltransferase 2 family protein
VVAVFPFTIGGVGARELTFILGYQFLGIDQNVAVAFSLLFFLITAVVSMVGGFLKTSE